VRAAVVTAAASTIVYVLMRRPQRRLSATAEQLNRFLESRQTNLSGSERFENPHRVHCRDVLDCSRSDCPLYDAPEERCWQLKALSRATREHDAPAMEIEECHACEVYRRCCPDKLTELGESFNNLMFLLDEEARQVGRMRAKMLEKEKMVAIGQIASGIAHEVGNPLSSISSIVQMLKRNGLGEPTAKQLDLIETHIQRISAIVRQLVGLARPGVDRWELVDIGQILQEAVQLVAFDRRARNIEIDFVPPARLPRTYGLRGQLAQVFINLLLNALDAMPEGGTLVLRAEARRREIIIRVRDTGSGIPPETGRRIFEPFYTTKEPGRGTGLGLAVSFGVIQKHGGTIDFSSPPGGGTVFTVEIPVSHQPPDA
jgi:signal transduction histidine kinase